MDGGCFSCVFVILIFVAILNNANCQRLHDDMYKTLFGGAACFRRLNGTHQTGCSSGRGGSVGTVHVVAGPDDVQFALERGAARPYALVLPLALATPELLLRLAARPDAVAGVVLTNEEGAARPPALSHAARCPNAAAEAPAPSPQCSAREPWNPLGSGLLRGDFPFPIFYLPPTKMDSINALRDCFLKFNSHDLDNQVQRSLCAVDMDAFMYAAVDSRVCLRKSRLVKNLSQVRYCDPLGGKSVFLTLFPRGPLSHSPTQYHTDNVTKIADVVRKPVAEKNNSVLLITTDVDSTSFFEGEGFGAVSAISGMVTVLGAVQLLHAMFPASQSGVYEANVLVVFLNGEAYDNMGSQRLAWDLSRGTFPEGGPPLPLSALGRHVHVGQLRNSRDPLRAFAPRYDQSYKNNMVDETVSWLNSSEGSVGVERQAGARVPPSAVHSFLRQLPASPLSSVLLADHGDTFSNRYYHSLLDDAHNLNYTYYNITNGTGAGPAFPDELAVPGSVQERLAGVATMLARAAYRHVRGEPYRGPLRASPVLLDELLHCFLEAGACAAAVAAGVYAPLAPGAGPPPPPPAPYVGVRDAGTHYAARLRLLALLLAGAGLDVPQEECRSAGAQYAAWLPGWDGKGHCYRAYVNTTSATSPAFEIPDYDLSSQQYSTWTESVWSSMSLRLLVVPARRRELLALGLGGAAAALSLLLTLAARRHVASLAAASPVLAPDTLSPNVDC